MDGASQGATIAFVEFWIGHFRCVFVSQHSRVHLLDTESFETTFGPKSQRKRPRLAAADVEVSKCDL